MEIQSNALTVSELSNLIKYSLETLIGSVTIKGEISNLKKHPSGHLYFSLIDNDSIISAVCWNSKKTNIKNIKSMRNGLQVIVNGLITSYHLSSKYQISIQNIEIYEEGKIEKKIEEKRIEFEKKGYFSNKRKINKTPEKICLITSSAGAAMNDVINNLKDRYYGELRIFHSDMQGKNCSNSLVKKIIFINENLQDSDTIIIARGGGSKEDLSEFNEEKLIKAIFNSKIPIISAIGHETDNVLCDLAADKRASTPTAAAQIATMEIQSIKDNLENIKKFFLTFAKYQIDKKYVKIYQLLSFFKREEIKLKEIEIKKPKKEFIEKQIDESIIKINFFKPKVEILSKKIFELHKKIIRLFYISSVLVNSELSKATVKIDKLKPKSQDKNLFAVEGKIKYLISSILLVNKTRTLKRGYALLEDFDSGKIISSIKDMNYAKKIIVNLRDGKCKIKL